MLRQHYGGYELRRLLAPPHPRHLGTVHPGRRMAPHLQRHTPRPRPGPGVLRPLAAQHHAPHHRHHPHMHAAMRDAPQPRRLGCSSRIPLTPAPRRIPRPAQTAGASRTWELTRDRPPGHRPAVWGGRLTARRKEVRAGSPTRRRGKGRRACPSSCRATTRRWSCHHREHAQREDRPPPVAGSPWGHDGHVGLLGLELPTPLDTVLNGGAASQRSEETYAVGPVHRHRLACQCALILVPLCLPPWRATARSASVAAGGVAVCMGPVHRSGRDGPTASGTLRGTSRM